MVNCQYLFATTQHAAQLHDTLDAVLDLGDVMDVAT